jgi:hypothetical protein
MARAAGVEMTERRLHDEGGRRYFLSRRFDHTADGRKLHLQSLAALAHLNFNATGAHSYEQALQVVRRLGLDVDIIEQRFRHMLFNVVARNHDDHVENIAFLATGRPATSRRSMTSASASRPRTSRPSAGSCPRSGAWPGHKGGQHMAGSCSTTSRVTTA